MNYIGLAFLDDFSTAFSAKGVQHAFFFWPFLALTLAGPAFRFAAFLRRTKSRAKRADLGAERQVRERTVRHNSPVEHFENRRERRRGVEVRHALEKKVNLIFESSGE